MYKVERSKLKTLNIKRPEMMSVGRPEWIIGPPDWPQQKKRWSFEQFCKSSPLLKSLYSVSIIQHLKKFMETDKKMPGPDI